MKCSSFKPLTWAQIHLPIYLIANKEGRNLASMRKRNRMNQSWSELLFSFSFRVATCERHSKALVFSHKRKSISFIRLWLNDWLTQNGPSCFQSDAHSPIDSFSFLLSPLTDENVQNCHKRMKETANWELICSAQRTTLVDLLLAFRWLRSCNDWMGDSLTRVPDIGHSRGFRRSCLPMV